MSHFKNALLPLGLLAIAACSPAPPSSLDVLVGDSLVRVATDARVVAGQRDIEPNRDYGATLEALEEAGALSDVQPAASPWDFSIDPSMGEYALAQSFVSRDGCGFDQTDAQPLDEYVVDFVADEQQYVRLFTGTESGDVLGDICVLDGRLYTCYKPDQIVDFAFADLDAEVVIRTDEQGIWSTESRYVALSRQTVQCEGSQCDQEPASTLLDLIAEPMPCNTLGIASRTRLE